MAIAERVKEFKREEQRRKVEYENEMIKIYSKVFQRPLLIESGGMEDSPTRTHPKDSRRHQPEENEGEYLENYYEGDMAPRHPNQHEALMGDDKRRAAVEEHHPGQYPVEDYEGEDMHGEGGYIYGEDYPESEGEYEGGGNLHTS